MRRPQLVGILNVTPDSFSGDGVSTDAALAKAEQMVRDGADILDIGAESTRPSATPIHAQEEWARLSPALHAIVAAPWRPRIRLSIDTRHALTAHRALDLGVDIINDVGGLRDDRMCALLSRHEGDIIVMHALSIPADHAHTFPKDCDIVAELLAWKEAINAHAQARGIALTRLIYDAGIGFGKTAEQSLALLLAAQRFQHSGGRWLYGHSRKSFLSIFSKANAAQRDDLTLAFSAQLAAAHADYLRVHHVARHTAMFDQLCT